MCGFAGVLDPRAPEDLGSVADAMADAVAHRGPDDRGCWTDLEAGVALSHRRLSIIDTSHAGRQPMADRSGRWILAYNGEVYDYVELAAALEAERPIDWRTHTDTEVLVEAIARWGVRGAIERCNGMFAFAVWDRQERRLTLARDRLGEKPLYWAHVGGRFLFGSELRALEVAHRDFEVDPRAVNTFLRLGYIPDPWTIYTDARKLEPGTLLEVDAGRDLRVHSPVVWWSLLETIEHAKANPFRGSEEDAVDALEELLLDSVRLRLRADVPIGTWLSGGIDSTLVTALAQQVSSHPVKTFTVAFPGTSLDESEDAAKVAAFLGTDHTTISIDEIDPEAAMRAAIDAHDEPFADPSSIAVCLLAQRTREHVTVALAGDGGDELFAGYNRHFLTAALWPKLRRIPRPLRSAVGKALDRSVPKRLSPLLERPGLGALQVRNAGEKLRKLAEVAGAEDADGLYRRLVSVFDEPASVTGTDAELPTLLDERTPRLDWLERILYLDSAVSLPGDMLVKTDRTAMASSLEVRLPLLDPRLVTFAWSLPMDLKMRAGSGKRLLKCSLRRRLPGELIDRPKAGFDPPVGAWLATDSGDHPYQLWTSYAREQWLRRATSTVPGAVR